jgi:L-alanine-DL-glutamate epimerase-like enolase superfamily enzyme
MVTVGDRAGLWAIAKVDVASYTIPTDAPESDGTFTWDRTTLVVVHATAGGTTGIGYTYADKSAAGVIASTLTRVVSGRSAMDVEGCYVAMMQAVRNAGRQGIAASAISAVDIALWDLKARLLDVPLVSLIGGVREGIRVYGSGGFTSYSADQLQRQLGGWAASGITAVKMKIGRDRRLDRVRVARARAAIGPDTELFVDANGAYAPKEAFGEAERFVEHGVTWFEEPVSSDDLEGLRLMRERAPAGMDIAAGEYGYEPQYFRRMVSAGAVDVLQADATRCGGVTGFLRAAAIADAWCLPMSAHTAPGIHTHLSCAVARIRHLEYFHDHVRIERMLFDGVVDPVKGELRPDLSRPGLGIEFKSRDAARFAVSSERR